MLSTRAFVLISTHVLIKLSLPVDAIANSVDLFFYQSIPVAFRSLMIKGFLTSICITVILFQLQLRY